ncbi:glycosyltransferase [Solicola gregarius]|uniref:Sulfotransferase n=1 Tax=Solicola gregarius TaxID=2908642 RepID=A0AA46TJL0_9ACTN|nr:glycosyltransferase [Solicola gregarius]UYM06549.1 sulfotransferase [Solicola gregarius]
MKPIDTIRPDVPLVLVTVGSDHHRFDRLVDWIDAWVQVRDADEVQVFVQHGTSKRPSRCASQPYVPHDELNALMSRADVVVTQGGPMSIVEARDAGCVPVVVPRDPALHEHVDGHQIAFCRRLDDDELIRMAATRDEFGALLDAALVTPDEYTVPVDGKADARVAEAARRLSNIVTELSATPTIPKVLLILGSGRSGSTLLERTLGEVAGVSALGETVHLWERGVRDHELCGCGVPFDACEFWSAVGKSGFDGWSNIDPGEMIDGRHRVVRTRRIPELIAASPSARHRLERERMVNRLDQLYRAAQQVSGSRLLVDSSKLPAYAALLRRANVDVRCVFVVRDPRGVAHSWGKSVERPEVVGEQALMPRYSAARSAATWTMFAGLAGALRASGIAMTTVRYEDFLAAPADTVRHLLDFADHDLDPGGLAQIDGRRVRLGNAHTVAGNPMRFRTGTVDLVRDDAWRSQLPARDRRVVELLTLGVRRALGY